MSGSVSQEIFCYLQCVSVWDFNIVTALVFAGVGYATMTIVFFLDIYYCIIIAWTIFYLIATFVRLPGLPWQTCGTLHVWFVCTSKRWAVHRLLEHRHRIACSFEAWQYVRLQLCRYGPTGRTIPSLRHPTKCLKDSYSENYFWTAKCQMASFVTHDEDYEYRTSHNLHRLHYRPWAISKNEIQNLPSQNPPLVTLCRG
jgi:hypothetical protein